MSHPLELASLPQAQPGQWRLDALKAHPRQDAVFDALNASELAELARSLDSNGLQHPIHITPEGVILAGHQRVAAAQQLGWATIDVIVRHDLVAQGEAAVDAFIVEDNLHRRQLDPIGMARAYQELQRLEKLHRPKRYAKSGAQREDLRDRLAKRFGRSGRQLDRYLRLLDLPRPIQTAISQQRLPVSTAERLFELDGDELGTVMVRVERGEEPKKVVGDYLAAVVGRRQQTSGSRHAGGIDPELVVLLSFFQKHLDGFQQYLESLPEVTSGDLDSLQLVQRLVNAMFNGGGKRGA